MDDERFDRLTRRLGYAIPRRPLIAAITGALFSTLKTPEPALACKHVGRKCDKNKDCCDGATCRGGKNSKCQCKSGFDKCGNDCVNFDNNEDHCGGCDTVCAQSESCCDGVCNDFLADDANCGACGAVCDATEECVGGVCITPPGGCPPHADSCATGEDVACAGGSTCECAQTTEGTTACGDVATPGAACGQCQSSADCASFGPGAFCVATDSINCCGPSGNNVCRLPCAS
jgi:hypothetical protein